LDARSKELARGIGFLVVGIAFILAGIYVYHLLTTYSPMGYQFQFWAPIFAPIFIIAGIIFVIFGIFYTGLVTFAVAVDARTERRHHKKEKARLTTLPPAKAKVGLNQEIREIINDKSQMIYRMLENYWKVPHYDPFIAIGAVKVTGVHKGPFRVRELETGYVDPSYPRAGDANIIISPEEIEKETESCKKVGIQRTIQQTCYSKLAGEYTRLLQSSIHNFSLQKRASSFIKNRTAGKSATSKELVDFLVGMSKIEAFYLHGQEFVEKKMGYFSEDYYLIAEERARNRFDMSRDIPIPRRIGYGTSYVALCHYRGILNEMEKKELLRAFREDPFITEKKERIEVAVLLKFPDSFLQTL